MLTLLPDSFVVNRLTNVLHASLAWMHSTIMTLQDAVTFATNCEQSVRFTLQPLATFNKREAVMLQAEQLRKCAYVSASDQDYDPEKDRTCTIYAGTMVQQVNTTCALF